MFRLWGKIWKAGRILRDTTVSDDSEDTRTHKVMHCLEKICWEFDLPRPIWLEANIRQFKQHDKTRFTKDSFIEQIDFDCLEIQVLEEDQGSGQT